MFTNFYFISYSNPVTVSVDFKEVLTVFEYLTILDTRSICHDVLTFHA